MILKSNERKLNFEHLRLEPIGENLYQVETLINILEHLPDRINLFTWGVVSLGVQTPLIN